MATKHYSSTNSPMKRCIDQEFDHLCNPDAVIVFRTTDGVVAFDAEGNLRYEWNKGECPPVFIELWQDEPDYAHGASWYSSFADEMLSISKLHSGHWEEAE